MWMILWQRTLWVVQSHRGPAFQIKRPQPRLGWWNRGPPKMTRLKNPRETRIYSGYNHLAQLGREHGRWGPWMRPLYTSLQDSDIWVRKAGCGCEMLEKMQNALFLLNVLDTSLEDTILWKLSQARELTDKICCFFVLCVWWGAAL